MSPSFDAKYDVPLIVLAILIITTNFLAIFLFVARKTLRTKTNCLLCSLATSDFLTGSLGIPLFIACNTSPHSTVLYTVAVIIYRFISVSTALHILAATIERYIFVVYPLRYQVYVTTGRVLVVVGFVWGISSTVADLQIMWVQFRFGDEANKATLLAEYVHNISGIVLLFSLPVVVMLYTDVRMLLIIRRQRLQILKQRVFSLRGARDFKQDVKSWSTHLRSVITFFLMLVVYVVCWTTWYLSLFYEYLDITTFLPAFLWAVFDFLQFSTALINPILYTIIKTDFRNALCRIRGRRVNPSSSYPGMRLRTITRTNALETGDST